MTVWAVVFFASAAAIGFAYVGYPALAWTWARVAPRPVHRQPFTPDVTVVIAAHDAAGSIGRKIANCLSQDYPGERLAVIVASDGSQDGTAQEVRASGDARVRLLEFAQRRGKAACLNDAVAACRTDFVVFCDVRQSLRPTAVRELLQDLADPQVGVVSGQLVFDRSGMSSFGGSIDAYWSYEKLLRRAESAIHSAVGATGAIYAMRRECFRPIPAETILDDVLIPMNVVMQGRRVVFEDAAIAEDLPSREAQQERMRKVRTLAGNFQLLQMHPEWLLPWRNPIALQFFCHKVMRLLVPAALVGVLAANIPLAAESPFFLAALLTQLACYAAAAVGSFWPRAAGLRPVRFAATFVALNWFVVLGLWEYLMNPTLHLWVRTAPGNNTEAPPRP